jgi:hypothetical protein
MKFKSSEFSYNKFYSESVNTLTSIKGVVDETSERQKKNGTVQVLDTVTGASYALYTKSGYLRRVIKNYCTFWDKLHNRKGSTIMYQLNKTRMETHDSKIGDWTYSIKKRIMIEDSETMIELTINGILNYRKV